MRKHGDPQPVQTILREFFFNVMHTRVVDECMECKAIRSRFLDKSAD
jgi:hypothetical protein